MNLKDIYQIEGPSGLRLLAAAASTDQKYLYQCATGRKLPGPKLVNKLVDADRRLTREELRPDIFRRDGDAA
jgi:hypothetical protein